MLKPIKGFLLLTAAASLGLSSCSDESPWAGSDSEGGIKLDLSADARVMRQTRADENVSPVVPEADMFTVNLKNADGSYSKDWQSIEAFNRESSFPIGDYTLTASYGDINVQGFELPYFMGYAPVHVSPSEETEVKVVATLGNSMVSVRYTDAFTQNFPKYSAKVQSEGHDWVVFAQEETRPAYIAPGNEVKLNLTLTDTEGREVTIQPATFSAEARHHYIVTIGVNGSTGNLVLNVQFEENVINETVEVSLGDDLFTAQPPVVKAVGFAADSGIEGFEGLTDLPSAEFQVITFGGLSKANLNFETDSSFVPAFGKSAQLVNADESLQNQLSESGIECVGFFKKPEKMGLVRITDFLKKLPAGVHTVELQAVDALTRVSDPVKITINLRKVQFVFGQPATVVFGDTEIYVDINTNCAAVKDMFTFRAPDSNNRMVDVSVKNVEDLQTPGTLGYTYRYTLSVDPQNGSEVDVIATYNGSSITTKLPVAVPEYTLVPDAFAHHVLLKVSDMNVNASQLVGSLKFFNNGSEISKNNISFDSTDNIIKIVGLQAGATYDKMTSQIGKVSKPIPSFTTEYATDVPNGSFNEVNLNAINITSIQTGGSFGRPILGGTYTITSSIIRNTAAGWADLNDWTCYINPSNSNANTWFVVPSVWVETSNGNNEAVIRSVGYSHEGETLAKFTPSSSTVTNKGYWSTVTPKNLLKKTGELFIGNYSYNGNESRTDGMSWTSRPSSLSFDYKYKSIGDEKGVAYITVMGENNEELVSAVINLSASDSYQNKTISLGKYKFGSKAKWIKLGFKSSDSSEPEIYIPQGDELNDGVATTFDYSGKTVAANQYKAVATGSVLTIDNVKFGYDSNISSAVASKRKSSNKRR